MSVENESCQVRDLLQHGYRFALALTHDQQQSEDLVQEVALRALRSDRNLSRFGFLRAIKNCYIDELRRLRACPGVLSVDENVVGPAHDEREAEWDVPLQLANGALPRALGEIRPEERGVVYLWAVEEMSAQRIADLTGWPRSTVLSLLQRGRAKLRRLLG